MTNAIVIGGSGALGRAVVSAFKSFSVINVDFNLNNSADSNVVLDKDSDNWVHRTRLATEQVESTLQHQKVDAVIHCAGGWQGGALGEDSTLDAMDAMWKMNLQSAILASHLAARVLNPKGGLAVLTGAYAALEATPDMAAYGMSKAATHHLVQSLSKTLPSTASALGILPVTIDTEMNRKFMPDADFSSWTPVDEISNEILKWTKEVSTGLRPASGALMSALTKDSQTVWKNAL